MDIQEVLKNIEQYEQPQQDAIRLAVATADGEELELMLRAIVGE